MARRDSLDALRRKIDRVDNQLLELLNQRAALVVQVGEQKRREKASIYRPSREKDIFRRLQSLNDGPLHNERVRAIFREIISACLALEQPLHIACLGPLGTFSHQAVLEQFGTQTTVVAVDSFSEVFDEVEHQRVDYGIVPVENSTEGAVAATLDRLVESPLTIKAEVQLRVEQCLMSRTGKAEKIRRIVSHPQSLGQCRHWLQINYPRIAQIEAGSNSQAAELAARNPGTAAIAGRIAADLLGLKIIASNIQDQANNYTRFLVLGRDGIGKPSGDDKTSVVLSAPHEAGALYRILKPFADNNVSLCNIESRPLKGHAWEYVFFLDMVGHVDSADVALALDAVREQSLFCRVLGSYPAALRPA